MAVDASAVEGVMNHLWLTALSDEKLKQAIGLKYISHMWRASPYWYLWFDDSQGVYQVTLKRVGAFADYDWLAEFAVKYYPGKDEACYNGLSLLEQICRDGEAFATTPAVKGEGCPCCGGGHGKDNAFADLGATTGAPSYAFAATIPEDFFFVGKLVLAHKEEAGMAVGLESQRRWRVVMIDNYYLTEADGQPYKVLRKGETDRDYPGVEITRALYGKIVLGLEKVFGLSAAVEDETVSAGMTFFSDGLNLWMEPTDDAERVVVCRELKKEGRSLAPLLAVF
jgi:hypothetical protein